MADQTAREQTAEDMLAKYAHLAKRRDGIIETAIDRAGKKIEPLVNTLSPKIAHLLNIATYGKDYQILDTYSISLWIPGSESPNAFRNTRFQTTAIKNIDVNNAVVAEDTIHSEYGGEPRLVVEYHQTVDATQQDFLKNLVDAAADRVFYSRSYAKVNDRYWAKRWPDKDSPADQAELAKIRKEMEAILNGEDKSRAR